MTSHIAYCTYNVYPPIHHITRFLCHLTHITFRTPSMTSSIPHITDMTTHKIFVTSYLSHKISLMIQKQ